MRRKPSDPRQSGHPMNDPVGEILICYAFPLLFPMIWRRSVVVVVVFVVVNVAVA